MLPGTGDPVGAQAAVPGRARRWRTWWDTSPRSPRTTSTANRFPGAELGTIVGKAGLERQYDDTLRGIEGVRYMEVNARGRLVREDAGGASLQPTPGQPIITTIDLELQRYIDSIWPAGIAGRDDRDDARRRRSGRSTPRPPTIPNVFVGGISRANWRALNDDEARPLLNRAIQTRYPPGLAVQAGHRRHGAQARPHRARHPHADPVPGRACAWATGSSAAGRRKDTARST